MLIILISSVILLTLITLFIIYTTRNDDWDPVSISVLVLLIIILLTPICVVIGVQTTEDYNCEVNTATYESLQLRLEKIENASEDGNILSIKELNSIYDEIYSYNLSVKSYKHWANNIWTSWFYSKKVANERKYIEIKT